MHKSGNGPRFLSEQQRFDAAAKRPILSNAALIDQAEALHAESKRIAAEGQPFTGRIFPHTKSNDPILGVNKITYAHFIKTVWVLSNTNLHIKDFEAEFGADLRRMFNPVLLKNGSAALRARCR